MTLAWAAQVVFYVTFFVAWLVKELPHTTWVSVAAIAALVIAVLLVFDNRGVFGNHRA